MSDEVTTEETTITQEKMKYFRVRDSDGNEIAYFIPVSEYEEDFSSLEIIETSPVLILSASAEEETE